MEDGVLETSSGYPSAPGKGSLERDSPLARVDSFLCRVETLSPGLSCLVPKAFRSAESPALECLAPLTDLPRASCPVEVASIAAVLG